MFEERYIIKFNLKKDDGFWEIGREEDIFVDVKNGVNEKNNHTKASNKLKEKYKNNNIKIITVSYV